MATNSYGAIPQAESHLGPRSLFKMALAVALRNISSIDDVGDIPFHIAKFLLKHIENPDQLRKIELSCPQIGAEMAEMDDIWKALITKKFPSYTKNGIPTKEGYHWVDIYHLIARKEAKKLAEAEAAMRKQFAGYEKAKEDNQTHIVSSKLLPKAPGGPRRPANEVRPKAALSVLQKVRREVVIASRATRPVVNNGRLPPGSRQLQKAPEWMVHEHRVAHNPGIAHSPGIKIHVPRKKKPESSGGFLAERESRLLAIKKQEVSKSTTTSNDFDDMFADFLDEGDIPGKKPSAGGDSDDEMDDIDALFRAASRKREANEGESSAETARKRARLDESTSSPQPPRSNKARSSAHSPSTAATLKRSGGLLSNSRGSGLLSNAPRSSSAASLQNTVTRKVAEAPAKPTVSYRSPQNTLKASASVKSKSPAAADDIRRKMPEQQRTNGNRTAPRTSSQTPYSDHSSRASTSGVGSPLLSAEIPSSRMVTLPSVDSTSLPNQPATSPPQPRRPKKAVDIFMKRPKKVAR